MASYPTKKLIVPTVHPVGPLGRLVTPHGFSELYAPAFRGVRRVPPRPLPKSKLVQSTFGFIDPVFFPSTMNSGAFLAWITKLSRPRGDSMTSSQYLRALEILNAEFAPFVRGGISTWEEVLADIDWSKSPGLPYVNQGCSDKRQAWLKYETEIRDRADRLVKGEYVECIFIATPKDELLPPGKEDRIFLPAPFHHQLACAILFKKACDSLTATCGQHSSAIGLNIFGRGLESSLRRLAHFPYGYDVDRKGWDTSCREGEPERDFLKNGLPEEFHGGVNLVFNLAHCPLVQVLDMILQMCLNPSGWYCTTVFNTLKNYRHICEAYMDWHCEKEGFACSIQEMRDSLRVLAGGDDGAFSTEKSWFTVLELAQWEASRGIYTETDFLEARDPMTLTFFSHNLYRRYVPLTDSYVLVACGRLSKHLSAFSYLKRKEGRISYVENASRFVGLMMNIWSYGEVYQHLYIYFYHLIHHLFLLDGQHLTSEWRGVFRAMPTDQKMLRLRMGYAREEGFVFSPVLGGSSIEVKRTLQSALKVLPTLPLGDMKKAVNKKLAQPKKVEKQLRKLDAYGKNEAQRLRKELSLFKNEMQDLKKMGPSKSEVIQASHATSSSSKKGWRDIVGSLAQSAARFIKEKGMETLFTLSTSLLASDYVRRQPGVTLATVPAGTILGFVDLYPNFADQQNPGSTSRLSRIASTYLRWKFTAGTCVNFVPSAGVLANGQIGMFITSDPRYELTATGQDAVRLVHEFNGVVTQLSQPACLDVPSKAGDWLYVEDAHASDIRFTRQGTLWVIAFTDIDTTGLGSSLGEFRLDYNCDLKDNSLDGAVIANGEQMRGMIVNSALLGSRSIATPLAQNYALFDGSARDTVVTTPGGESAVNVGTGNILYNFGEVVERVAQNTAFSTYRIKEGGLYRIKWSTDWNDTRNVTAATTVGNTRTASWFVRLNFVNSLGVQLSNLNISRLSFPNAFTNTSGTAYAWSNGTEWNADYYLQLDADQRFYVMAGENSAGTVPSSMNYGPNTHCFLVIEQITKTFDSVTANFSAGVYPAPTPIIESDHSEVQLLRRRISQLEMEEPRESDFVRVSKGKF